MESGQVAYEGYRVSCGGKSVHGEELPGWDDLPQEIRAHWRAALDAVRMYDEMRRQEKPHRISGRSQEVWDALKAAGIVREGDYVRRVIIDIDVSSAVIVYIERYADTRALGILPVIGSGRSEIVSMPKPPSTVAEAEQV